MLASLAALVAIAAAGVSAAPSGTVSAPPPGATLNYSFHWIRSTASDVYLQGATPLQPGMAVLGTGATAGQFNIVSTGLIQLTSKAPSYTYATVDPTTGQVMLVEGDVPAANSGTFAWSGTNKELVWTSPAGVQSPNFLSCDSQLFVQLPGVTPAAGCTATTIESLQTLYVE